jgi:predicted pyridoxine 5'-phosphate oxidase superfamily flavin-nucleotide-binding protein
MASTLDRIDDHLRRWIAEQPMFFVATAPLDETGHVNVSPKGPIGTFSVLDDHTVAYLDFYGSGAETIAHIRENGRIVVMLCAFDGPPKIIRLHGTGTVVFPDEERFAELMAGDRFEGLTDVEEARRAVVVVDVERIAKSCGYGVPLMDFVGEREHFDLSKRKRLRTMGAEGFTTFQVERNARSLDGLPATESTG